MKDVFNRTVAGVSEMLRIDRNVTLAFAAVTVLTAAAGIAARDPQLAASGMGLAGAGLAIGYLMGKPRSPG